MNQQIAIVPNSEDDARQRFLRYTENKAAYFPIAKECLITKSRVTFNIYCLKNDAIELVCRTSASDPGIVEDTMKTLSDPLFIDSADVPKYATYLSEITTNRQQSSSLGIVLMQERSKIVMKQIFEQPTDSQHVSEVTELAEDMLTCILTRDQVLIELLMIKRTSFQVYVHSVNVAMLSMLLGRLLKLSEETLLHLGIGAFLHDIGKRSLPKEILGKQGKLDQAEFSVYKQHVLNGVRLLESTWKVPAPSIVAVSQHHEVLNGKGYPNGLEGSQIEPFGRIMVVTNSFDNLISPRPNKYALHPLEALKVLIGERNRFDLKILSTFVEMLSRRR